MSRTMLTRNKRHQLTLTRKHAPDSLLFFCLFILVAIIIDIPCTPYKHTAMIRNMMHRRQRKIQCCRPLAKKRWTLYNMKNGFMRNEHKRDWSVDALVIWRSTQKYRCYRCITCTMSRLECCGLMLEQSTQRAACRCTATCHLSYL